MRFIPVLLACLWTCQSSLAADPAPPTASAAAPAAGADQAAKHAKLAACREQARVKKLIGADKKDFIARCVAAPQTVVHP